MTEDNDMTVATGKCREDDSAHSVARKPRLCEVLGVDVGERFRVRDGEKALGPLSIALTGDVIAGSIIPRDVVFALTEAINHPEKIEREPRLTDKERDICRILGVKWVSRDVGSDQTDLWCMETEADEDNFPRQVRRYIGHINKSYFPSVRPGHLILVEDAT